MVEIAMEAFRFSCPHCSVVLRLQDRAFVGQQIVCPDCGNSFSLTLNDQGSVIVRKRLDVAGNRPGIAAALSDALNALAKRLGFAHCLEALKSPVGIAWMVAIVCTIALAIAVTLTDSSAPGPTAGTIETQAVPQANAFQEAENNLQQTTHNDDQRNGNPINKRPLEMTDLIETQLAGLGNRLRKFHEQHGRFPNGTGKDAQVDTNQQFSWLAALAADFDRFQNVQPLWDHSWMDPLNDRFVRRRIPEFHNPAVEQLVATNGYPATHFVGVCGVGKNAATLRVTDPRAGVFGINRQTTLENITDGTSNTMMIAGVEKNLDAWAAGGRATLRAFTRTPYVNGPDGFGTGQSDGMFVLKADGSVQFLSSKIDPTILRRMAAMADGLPLDPSVPGEPGGGFQTKAAIAEIQPATPNRRNSPDVGPVAAENNNVDGTDEIAKQNQPVQIPPVPAPAVDAQPLDVKTALEQRIVSFTQTQPCPFSRLLAQIEEMAGVPIQVDEQNIDSSMLEQPVTLTLKDTTIRGLLHALVLHVGLVHEIHDDGIQIRRPGPLDETP